MTRHTIDNNLSEDQKHRLFAVVKVHQHAFDFQNGNLGRANFVEHSVDTGDASPIPHGPYRVSSVKHQIIGNEVSDMLEKVIIRPSSSSWLSPVVIVNEKCGWFC